MIDVNKKVNLFIVGEPKCGTTALHNLLNKHPDIFMSPIKETGYFHIKERLRKVTKLREYHDLFSDSVEKIIGESTPGYIREKRITKKIYDYNPNAKIIILFREPISYLKSIYRQNLEVGVEKEKNFKKALNLEQERIEGKKIPKLPIQKNRLFHSKHVEFSKHLLNYLEVFPKEQIKVILFEDLKNNFDLTMKSIFEFLDIDLVKIDNEKHNVSKDIKHIFLYYLIVNLNLIPFLKKIIPHKIYNTMKKIFYTKKEKISLSDHFKNKLMVKYKPEVVKLNDLLHEYNLIEKDLVEFWGYENV